MNLAPSPETQILFEEHSAYVPSLVQDNSQPPPQPEPEVRGSVRLDLAAIVLACLTGWTLMLGALFALIF